MLARVYCLTLRLLVLFKTILRSPGSLKMKFLHIIMVAIFMQIVFIILHFAMQIGILLKMYKISDFIFDSARVFIAVDMMQWQDDEECRNSLSDWGHSSIKNESKISLTLSKLSLSIWSFLHFNEWEKISRFYLQFRNINRNPIPITTNLEDHITGYFLDINLKTGA